MASPIIEQIAVKIYDALDGKQDPDGVITFNAVRSKILNVTELQLVHGDVLIEFLSKKQVSATGSSRYEKATFRISGFVSNIPEESYADTYLIIVAETICKLLHAENTLGTALGGLASKINCPGYTLMFSDGGVDVMVDCEVDYSTTYKDGYLQS